MKWLRTTFERCLNSAPRLFLFAAVISATLTGFFVFSLAAPPLPKTPTVIPQYDKDGALLRPKDFYSWTFVGSSIGLSYSKTGSQSGPGLFHNVYTQPEAYREYMRTGTFPEKTMFILAMYDSANEVSIAKHGFIEGDFADMDVSVKDHQHFPEGWAYFNFSGENGKLAEKAKAFPKTACFTCHAEHGEHDNVFTQFYPILRKH